MNGVRSLSPANTRSPMWVMLKIFIFQGGHVLAPQMKILSLKLGVNFAFALAIIFFAHFQQK